MEINIPDVPQSKITNEIINKVEAMLQLLASDGISEAEKTVFEKYGINPATQRLWKSELRKLFNSPPRSPLTALCSHNQIRQALKYIIVRSERNDKYTLRSAKNLSIILPNGETLDAEDFIKSLYPREGVNASSCYRALKAKCLQGKLLKQGGELASAEDLPSESSVVRFLRNWRKGNIEVRRGRSRKRDFAVTEMPYVTRDVTQFSPGEVWIGDHCELDFLVRNEQNRLDRRWITAWIDFRTSLITGYHLSWCPSSKTIGLSFRNAVLGTQIRAFNGEKYIPVQINNAPETVVMDNGKDYKSKYTQKVFGKIDFGDYAQRCVKEISKLHYCLPHHPESKAQMERWFGTIQGMTKYLPGYKGNVYQNKPDSLDRDMKLGKLLEVEQFDKLIELAICTYNNRIHRSLKQQTPLQYYLTHQTHQRTIDTRVLDFLLMKTENKKISRCEVTLLTNKYYSDQLMTFNGKFAEVYYDPHDLGFISVYVKGDFAAVAYNKVMLGKDEFGWKKILRDRTRAERNMNSKLNTIKRGITDHQVRAMLFEGELLNIEPVSNELLDKKVTSINVLTGFEQKAFQNKEELDRGKVLVEVKRKQITNKNPMITIDSIKNIQ